MAGSEFGRKSIAIFLALLGFLLLIYIGANSIGAFKQSRSSTEQGVGTAADCVGEVYRISQIGYDSGTLRFRIKYESFSSVDEISTLTVISDIPRTINVTPLVRGMAKDIKIENINIGSNFSVYADSCNSYKVVCDMGLLECA
jgi:hypothetical protein